MLSTFDNNNHNSNCCFYFGRGNTFFWVKNNCCFSVGLFVGPTFMFPALFRQFNYIRRREEDIFREHLNNAFS